MIVSVNVNGVIGQINGSYNANLKNFVGIEVFNDNLNSKRGSG